ncbi:MAG: quinolinate synthase NadA [Magnetococcales bacterium]|nr:quinolinate synthase NadA [Magnetococcales bacterium]NGZ28703.1 quinolinate synthase NadA [Magnetococcales bacterium]
MSQTPPVPLEPLYELDDAEVEHRTRVARQRLGDQCVILGHHYQREEVYKFADLTGDSLKLSRLASQRKEARYIVFCGVHFMAEVADMLSGPEQIAILPDMAAGCSMADMADLASVERVWQEMATLMPVEEMVTPVTYVNSSAELKSFCGNHGGIVCTSSNASKILEWSFAQRPKVLFFPDQHLGRNSGFRMGIPEEEMVTWNPELPLGGLTKEQILKARIILWHGYCSVHQMFQPEHVHLFRERYPGIKVIVHPECSLEVCRLADDLGSTERIQSVVRDSPPGSIWAIGTELNLVNRLKNEMPDKEIHFLCPIICMCSTMFRIDSQHLCWTLENLVEGYVVNPIHVPASIAQPARVALERMLSVM